MLWETRLISGKFLSVQGKTTDKHLRVINISEWMTKEQMHII